MSNMRESEKGSLLEKPQVEKPQAKRAIGTSIRRGFMRKCPNCNQGKLFSGYLSVQKECANCGEDFTHQRADDGPAWATMLITGHLVPPVIMGVYDYYENPNPFIVAAILLVFFSLVTLVLLPRVKGSFIGIQWANYMYGFNPDFREKSKA